MVKKKSKKSEGKSSKGSKKNLKVERVGNNLLDRKLRKDEDIAMNFATEIHKKFESVVKATFLFGSNSKHKVDAKDIDIGIIIDDASIDWDLELIAWYREELAKIVSKNEYAQDLHISTVKLTTWWDDLMHGDPVVINMIRYGEPLIDLGGFFNPIKALLIKGKIHSTPEAVYRALQRSPQHLARSVGATLSSFEGVYWTMVDAAQAALMTAGKLPPSPEHIHSMLKDVFGSKGLVKSEHMQWFADVFSIHKQITHREIMHIKGAEVDEWRGKAEIFMKEMSIIIDTLIESGADIGKEGPLSQG